MFCLGGFCPGGFGKGGFCLGGFCPRTKQPVVNDLQELGCWFYKQKSGENGMEIQED